MKERPIMFTGPMVRAILEGRKTQTRRVIKPQPNEYIDRLHGGNLRGRFPYALEDDNGNPCGMGFQDDNNRFWRCPYGVPGDRLWVRETFMLNTSMAGINVIYREGGDVVTLDPKEYQEIPYDAAWRPSIFMPRWASRITLEVVSVRVQRVQEIAENDAKAEGAFLNVCDWWEFGDGFRGEKTPIGAYRSLWDTINRKRGFGWGVNPWVWAIEFKRITP